MVTLMTVRFFCCYHSCISTIEGREETELCFIAQFYFFRETFLVVLISFKLQVFTTFLVQGFEECQVASERQLNSKLRTCFLFFFPPVRFWCFCIFVVSYNLYPCFLHYFHTLFSSCLRFCFVFVLQFKSVFYSLFFVFVCMCVVFIIMYLICICFTSLLSNIILPLCTFNLFTFSVQSLFELMHVSLNLSLSFFIY